MEEGTLIGEFIPEKKSDWPHVRSTEDHDRIAKRRDRVAELLHGGMSAVKIAAEVGVSYVTVYDDIKYLRKMWSIDRNLDLGAWQAQELQYCRERRDEALDNFKLRPNVQWGGLILRWTERIAILKGLDAPKKFDDWTGKSWEDSLKEYAEREGITEEEAAKRLVAEADRIINERTGSNSRAVSQGASPEGEPIQVEADPRQGWEAESTETSL
jgi:hypothetical protein